MQLLHTCSTLFRSFINAATQSESSRVHSGEMCKTVGQYTQLNFSPVIFFVQVLQVSLTLLSILLPPPESLALSTSSSHVLISVGLCENFPIASGVCRCQWGSLWRTCMYVCMYVCIYVCKTLLLFVMTKDITIWQTKKNYKTYSSNANRRLNNCFTRGLKILGSSKESILCSFINQFDRGTIRWKK